MKLPGGLVQILDGREQLVRDFSLRPLTGALEMQLQDLLEDCTSNQEPHPLWISRLLSLILARIGKQNFVAGSDECLNSARQLCVADRHYILLQWRLLLSGDASLEWLSAACPACEARYDFPLDWAQLPIKPAGESYPHINFARACGSNIVVRLPNGGDQEYLANISSAIQETSQLKLQLLQRLLPESVAASEFSQQEIAQLDLALEQASPELAAQIELACPECGHEHAQALDLYRGLRQSLAELLDQVHRLAVNYHWSEAEILALPKARRSAYLQRLDKARGLESGDYLWRTGA